MKIINRELLSPANILTIGLIVVLVNWVAKRHILRGLVDKRAAPRKG